jgi:hypothetical protein
MNTLPKDQNNIGGIARIWLIPSPLISSLQRSDLPFFYRLPDGWGDNAWQFDPIFQSASLDQQFLDSTAGPYWESVVTFRLPKLSYYNMSVIQLVAGRKYAILLMDQNSQYILVGSDRFPMRFVASAKTGADLGDLNHVELKFSGKATFTSLFIDNPF